MLELRDLNVHYDMIHAIKGISLTVEKGEIVTLIGANGAGKTTTLRTIAGLKKPTSGSVWLNGQDITETTPRQRVQMGAAMVPEGRHVFSEMTVQENLELGAYLRRDKEGIAQDMEMVCGYFPILKSRRKQTAGTLSGGEQQMLALGRALMTNGSLLMLDEPSMGLAPIIVEEIFKIIRQINESGTSILLIEQNAFLALTTASHAYVLETGKITMQGKSSDLLADKRVKDAYLGA